jgi:hypothetical protein
MFGKLVANVFGTLLCIAIIQQVVDDKVGARAIRVGSIRAEAKCFLETTLAIAQILLGEVGKQHGNLATFRKCLLDELSASRAGRNITRPDVALSFGKRRIGVKGHDFLVASHLIDQMGLPLRIQRTERDSVQLL